MKICKKKKLKEAFLTYPNKNSSAEFTKACNYILDYLNKVLEVPATSINIFILSKIALGFLDESYAESMDHFPKIQNEESLQQFYKHKRKKKE